MAGQEESYQHLFLRGYPVKMLIPLVMKSTNDIHNYEIQRNILKNTISSQLVKEYPLKLEYMMSFIKQILEQFEKSDIEVCDEWYEKYCELLNFTSYKQDTHFKHYIINDSQDKFVTIEENVNCISQGTTGLCTWQASQTLENWCSNNKTLLQNKCVLELGSGVGLAGLTICFKCIPKSYWFSDCHPSVLAMLLSNVKINVDREYKLSSTNDAPHKVISFGFPDGVEENILYQGRLNETSLFVMNLPWEDVPDNNITSSIAPDIVLAADVIYDSSSFLPLTRALCHLISDRCMAVLACTIRNEDTIKQFVDLLEQSHLCMEQMPVEESEKILDLDDVPVAIFQIRKCPIS